MQRSGNNANLPVSLIQINVTDNKDENNTNAVRLIRTAAQKNNSKLIVLPENFNTPHGNRQLLQKNAENVPNGETSTQLANLAKELKVWIVAGSIPERDEQNTNNVYNTMAVFSPNGALQAKHRQVHVIDVDITNEAKVTERDVISQGNTLTMVDMDGTKVGLALCWDMFYPEVGTIYRKNGIRIEIKLCAKI